MTCDDLKTTKGLSYTLSVNDPTTELWDARADGDLALEECPPIAVVGI
jgi:hypothetical protein